MKAAALNFFDTLLIAGKYQVKPPFPFSPASEFAGVVESVGADVTGFAAGDRVLGYGGFGAAREKIAISAQRVVKIPDALDFDRAAGITVIYGTTLHALKDRAKLKSGETLAVLGASGGTGLGRDRDRQADGRARDRLRVVRRQARLLQGARRRRGHQLRDRGPEGRAAPRHRRQRAPT